MADSVSVTTTNGAEYTWDSATFAWDSPDAGKTWATAFINTYAVQASETFATIESVAKAYGLNKTEAWQTVEKLAKTYGLNPQEAFQTLEAFDRTVTYQRSFAEAWNTAEAPAKAITLSKAESFHTADSIVKNIRLNPREAFQTAEVFGRTVAYNIFIQEGFTTVESVSKAFSMPVSEAFRLYDQYRRKANAVISDLAIGNTDISLADFENMLKVGSAAGYADFRPFMTGDYEYEKALFKVALQSINSDRPQIAALNVAVDVPDIFDRGGATVTASDTTNGLTVTFNRTFNVAPEVTMVLKSGTGGFGVPQIIGNITKTGFTFKILDGSSTSIPGTISWAAHGY